MRQRMHGRGLHPIVRDSSFRFWSFDDQSANVAELIDATRPLSPVASNPVPASIKSFIGNRARSFSPFAAAGDVLATLDASADSPTMQGEWTMSLWLRRTRDVTTVRSIFGLWGDSADETQPHNVQALLQFNSGNDVRFLSESGAGVNAIAAFTDYELPLMTWVHFTVRKTIDVTTADYELIVNAELLQTVTGLVNPDGGTDPLVKWKAGASLNGTTVLEEAPIDIASIHIWDEALPIDEIKADFRRGYLLDSFTHIDLKVETEDGNGLRRDLTDLSGVDFVTSARISENIDQAVATAQVELIREQVDLSVAYLRTQSKLNLTDVDVVNSYDPILEVARPIEIFSARVPLGIRANGDDWQSRFSGRIDTVDWSGDATILRCRDQASKLVDTYIEEEVLNPSIANPNDPSKQFSYGIASTGDALQNVLQDILDDNDNDTGNDTVPGLVPRTGSYDPITLVTEGTPNWLLLPYRQRREPVLSGLRNLAGQIGWECNQRWNPGYSTDSDGWALTLREPDRARLNSDLLLTESEVEQVTKLDINLKNIRNVVRVVYPSSETTLPALPSITGYLVRRRWSGIDGEGNRVNAFIELENIASVARYGRRFMEMGEKQSSQIDTITEAERFAFAAAEDLREPDIENTATIDCMFEIELNDVVRFEVIRELWTVIQKQAVVGITHTFGERATTELQLRGRKALGFKRWLSLETVPGQGRPAVIDPRLALTDSDAGPLLRVVRDIVDRTSYQSGGKYLSILNQDFQYFTAGVENPPDGWVVELGDWGTDVEEDDTLTLTGGHSVRFNGVNGILVSRRVGIQGDVNQPLSFELSWQVSAGAGNTPNLVVRWLDANGVNLGSTPLTPGGVGVNFPAVDPTVTGQWNLSRVDGIQCPFASARYMELELSTSGGTIYIDRVTGYRTSRATRAGKESTVGVGGWGTATGGTGLSYNQAMTVGVNVVAGVSPFDRGNQWVEDRTSGFPNNGDHFLTREPGTYDVRAQLIPVASAAGVIDYEWQLVLNGTYNAGGVRATGTVVATKRQTKTFVGPVGAAVAGADDWETEVILSDYNGTPGGGADRLTLDLLVYTAAPQMILNTGITTTPTFLSVKQRGLD